MKSACQCGHDSDDHNGLYGNADCGILHCGCSKFAAAPTAPVLPHGVIGSVDYTVNLATVAAPVGQAGFEHSVGELAQRVINENPPTTLSAAYRQVAKDLYHTINPIGRPAAPAANAEELKQARRDALLEVIELVRIAVPPTWNGSTRDAIEKAIRALMEKPE
jgi:hypothetical protein